ncbi:hypothetical protein CFII68_13021 [Pseudomonas sp. CFII68]|nr:hypothetical protein CFII68_13021 [Pseudomonas sp. CFII68]
MCGVCLIAIASKLAPTLDLWGLMVGYLFTNLTNR